MKDAGKQSEMDDRWARWAAFSLAIIGASLTIGFYVVWLVKFLPYSFDENAIKILQLHYQAILGLPAAAGVSFVLVSFLRQTDGPIQFQGLSFKFDGAAGQVAMWVICFLAITGGIKLLW